MIIVLWFIAFGTTVKAATQDTALLMPHVHPAVYRALQEKATINLMVTMRDGTTMALKQDGALSSESGLTSKSRGARISQLVASLKTSATNAQRPLLELLGEKTMTPAAIRTFWISNQMLIVNASIELVRALELEHGSSIAEIHEEQILTMNNFNVERTDLISGVDAEADANVQTWSVGKIGANAVWKMGVTGVNVTVATIDTGVRVSHEALRDNYRGDHGWFDPESQSGVPYDLSGHGTHVMGSIVGTKGIGVAPGAKWISCRGCRSASFCLESSLLACAQFVLCPTDSKGRQADCSKAPHIVNNSWGVIRGSTATFTAVIAAWQVAGIIPVFSIGNSGSPKTCGTAVSPGDTANVIGVGATNSNDVLLSQSSTGPSIDGRIKPDIVAPGVSIYSAWWTRDNVYTISSGTSVASPHVSGAAALLLSARPELTYEQVWTALTTTAAMDGDLVSNVVSNAAFHASCGNISDSTFPNNVFGYGRLDVQRAFALVTKN
ncbi:hypothetical protein PF003_g27840 [Phytophthora fragariae]|nr:hypothetical protein PF003_g27840 [Phytophthora fragariae]